MRRIYLPGVLVLVLLAACDQPAPPQPAAGPTSAATPTSAISTRPVVAATPQAGPTTPAINAGLLATPTAPPAVMAPVPTIPATLAPTIAAPATSQTVSTAPSAPIGKPDFSRELADYFREFYNTRTLQRGGVLSPNWVRNILDEPYLDYAISQVRKDMSEAEAGRLLEVSYSDISATLDKWQAVSSKSGSGTAVVSVKRTRHVTRKNSAPVADTATLRFKLQRHVRTTEGQEGTFWMAFDFFNPDTRKWVSQSVPPPPQEVKKGVAEFFRQFYLARSLSPGHKMDLAASEQMAEVAYGEYSLPLLRGEQAEADAGKLTGVKYSNIKTEVTAWYPEASNHGGLATVKVTRTRHVARPSGAEKPSTESFQFRAHRHQNEEGKENRWVAVDLLDAATGKWVSESAGMPGPLPQAPSG